MATSSALRRVLVAGCCLAAFAARADITACWFDLESARRDSNYGRVILEHIDLKADGIAPLAKFAAKVLQEELDERRPNAPWLTIELVNCWVPRLRQNPLPQPMSKSDLTWDMIMRTNANRVRLFLWGDWDQVNGMELSFALIPVLHDPNANAAGLYSIASPSDAASQPAEQQLRSALKGTPTTMLASLATAASIIEELKIPTRQVYDTERNICWPDAVLALLGYTEDDMKRRQKVFSKSDGQRIFERIAAYREEARKLATRSDRCVSGALATATNP